MSDLVAFINRCLDEDEAAARAATPGPWRYNPGKHYHRPWSIEFEESVFAGPPGASATSVALTGESDDRQSMADAAHIARHDPARVLREVAAKRAIIESVLPCPTCLEGSRCVPHDSSAGAPTWRPETDRDEHALKLLAAVYSDHPDYREEWRP